MSRPIKLNIAQGTQGWDDAVNTNFDQQYIAPSPLPRYEGDETQIEAAFPPALFDECVIWLNHTLFGYVLYVSTGSEWRPLSSARAINAQRWVFTDFHATDTNLTAAYAASLIVVNDPAVASINTLGGSALPIAATDTFGNVRISSGAGANTGWGFRSAGVRTMIGRSGCAFACILGFTGSLTARVVRIGFMDNFLAPGMTAQPDNGAYFELDGGDIEAVCASGGTRTKIGPTGGFVPDLTNGTDGNSYLFTGTYVAINQVRFCMRKMSALDTKVFDFTIGTNVSNGAPGFGAGVIGYKTSTTAGFICLLDYLGWGPALPLEFA